MVLSTTVPDAREEIPAFVERFTPLENLGSHVAALKSAGYTHFVNMLTNAFRVGDIDDEFGLMSAVAFFKGVPPELSGDTIPEEVPVVECRKFYANLSSVGRSLYGAPLTADEFAQWCACFKATALEVRDIEELI